MWSGVGGCGEAADRQSSGSLGATWPSERVSPDLDTVQQGATAPLLGLFLDFEAPRKR